ncbi:hypothetical protein D3C73_1080190 [compost metagenome]
MYGGASIRYTLDVGGQLQLQASSLYERGTTRYATGDTLTVGFHPEDALLLPDDSPVQGEGAL